MRGERVRQADPRASPNDAPFDAAIDAELVVYNVECRDGSAAD
jgi:hypothetical protein